MDPFASQGSTSDPFSSDPFGDDPFSRQGNAGEDNPFNQPAPSANNVTVPEPLPQVRMSVCTCSCCYLCRFTHMIVTLLATGLLKTFLILVWVTKINACLPPVTGGQWVKHSTQERSMVESSSPISSRSVF